MYLFIVNLDLFAQHILLWLKIDLLFAVMIAVWPTSGTNNRLVVKPSGTRDSQQIRDCVPEIPGQLEPMVTV